MDHEGRDLAETIERKGMGIGKNFQAIKFRGLCKMHLPVGWRPALPQK